jgi:nitric oxide reductase subunit C
MERLFRSDNGRSKIFVVLFVVFALYTLFVATSTPLIQKQDGFVANQTTRKGKLLFQEYNCISCHQFYGLGGYMGPDLTNSYSEKGEDVIRTFLKNGSDKMPDFGLSEGEIESLVAYLKLVDASGYYPVKEYELTWFGTVINKEVDLEKLK